MIFMFCKKSDFEEILLQSLIREENQIEYFFSNPFDSLNNLAIQKKILGIIKETEKEIYIFSYDLDDEEIINAIQEIYLKGVPVKIVLSPDQNYEKLKLLNLPYEVRQKSGLQHIKFILSDKTKFFSGTGNFTKSDIFYNSNLFFYIRISEEIGDLLIKKFYEQNYNSPIVIQKEFYKIKILDSPKNGMAIQSILNNAIINAKSFIDFFIFSFYDPTLMNSLSIKSTEFFVSGILDSSNLLQENSLISLLLNNSNLFLYKEDFPFTYLDSNFISHGGKLHHKTLIIDDILYTGSYNYSLSARDSNSEIFFEIQDPLQINKIKEEYRKIYNFSSLLFRQKKEITNNDTNIKNFQFCMETSGNGFYLQNKNSFFFMEYLDQMGCSSSRATYSSGIVSNSSDGFMYYKGISSKDFTNKQKIELENKIYSDYFLCTSEFCDFCEIFQCRFVKIHHYNSSSKILTLDFDYSSEDFMIWDGKKFFKGKILNKIQFDKKYYYHFQIYHLDESIYTNSLNEFILFLKQENFLFLGCVQTNQLRKNLKTFLTLQEWYSEKSYNWQELCYSLE